MNFIDYVKGLFGSKESDKPADEVKKELEEYIKSLTETEFQKPQLPDAPVFERDEYTPPTDEELKSRAESELEGYKTSGERAAENAAEEAKKKLESQKAAEDRAYESGSKTLESAYGKAKRDVENDALKRGLARSSIAVNRSADISKSYADSAAAAQESYRQRAGEIEREMSELGQKRQQALDEFNISYAAKLTQQMNALKEERDKRAENALKYNNSLAEKEAAAAIDKIMKESDLYGELLSQREKERELGAPTAAEQKRLYEAVYSKMDEALSKMSAAEARKAVRDDGFFKNNLNDYYYYKLFDRYAR